MLTAIHLKAKNDTNGNPRRLYLILDNDSDAVDAVDEGYKGRGALDEHYEGVPIGVTIQVTPKEYRDWLRHFHGSRV